MPLDAKTLENLILQGIPDAHVRIEDLRGDGEACYTAHVRSPSFAGRTRVQQHQMVYAALKPGQAELPPLAIHTSTPHT